MPCGVDTIDCIDCHGLGVCPLTKDNPDYQELIDKVEKSYYRSMEKLGYIK